MILDSSEYQLRLIPEWRSGVSWSALCELGGKVNGTFNLLYISERSLENLILYGINSPLLLST